MALLTAEIIKKKRNGKALTEKEIQFLIQGYCKDDIPDYQMSAWLMAVFFQGMNSEETKDLTLAILNSGITLQWPSDIGTPVDKHSTGGVGDKTSLILAPIVAAAGLSVPMISGRGLGHTGGTLDKLESIPGFQVNLSLKEFQQAVLNHGLCFIGQTSEICPADKKLYALRDVTGTVESLPLICSSILSKKISEGIEALVLDVKFGSGAFMKSEAEALALANKLKEVAQAHGKKVAALITSMEQPLGRFSGNALEVLECLDILRGNSYKNDNDLDLYEDTRLLSLELSAMMLWLGGKASSQTEGLEIAEKMLTSGAALEKFEEICLAQGGRLNEIEAPTAALEIPAAESGYIASINTEKVGIANIILGAGRRKTTDSVEAYAGIELCSKIGQPIEKGQPLFRLYGSGQDRLDSVAEVLRQTVNYSLQKGIVPDLITKRCLP